MEKNLTGKIVLILVIAIVAIWTLYPPQETLKPGLDLAGGTSLIYQIDTQGLKESDRRGLSQNMITVLRRRIDPANIQNLVWRPQGDTRFEIQMPLASVEARQKREIYENSLGKVLADNVNPAAIMRTLEKPQQQRQADFERFARGSDEKLQILNDLAAMYDQRQALRKERDALLTTLGELEEKLTAGGINVLELKGNALPWSRLEDAALQEQLQQYNEELRPLVAEYVTDFTKWAAVEDDLTSPDTGLNEKFYTAARRLSRFTLTAEQLESVLEMDPGSTKRKEQIDQLTAQFPDRKENILATVAAYDAYSPLRGGLDDPKDLMRMLQGAGILEFRILPLIGGTDLTADEIKQYMDAIKEKGPKYASDQDYVWVKIESIEDWQVANSIVAQFGNNYYVLASNKADQSMLHTRGEKSWRLKSSYHTQDNNGRRAIGFAFDDRGGVLFGKLTGKNINTPLAIVLDDSAISAPNIQSRITTSGIITGNFSKTQQDDMVNKLNAGSLPARLIEQPISVRSIGPLIGAANRDQGIKAGLVGLVAVVAFMLVYYTLAGAIADVALLLNILLVLAIMAFIDATFTLPGIAGIILTIGMSVDANVLIFERIREEQERGSSLRIAIRNGYDRAFQTIFDANLTTFITAAILYWVASEEIKGFAIVLMLGIASSMFTALFVTRVIFDLLSSKGIISDHLVMLRLVRNVNVNWMALRPVFFSISALLMLVGLVVFFTRDDTKNSKYDIEFTGGTSVQIDLKNGMSIQQVRDRLTEIGTEQGNPAISTANVYSVNDSEKTYEVTTTATNKTHATVTVEPSVTQSQVQQAVIAKLPDATVTATGQPGQFEITTAQPSKNVVEQALTDAFPTAAVSQPEVDEVVNDAILAAFGDNLKIDLSLEPKIVSTKRVTEDVVGSYPELADYINGVQIAVDLGRPAKMRDIQSRFKNLRFKPDMRSATWYPYEILAPDLATDADPNTMLSSFVFISVEPDAGFRQFNQSQWDRFAEGEKEKVMAAATLETSLARVTQISPSIGGEAKTRALIAIVLSLIAIIAYVWFRFGTARYGLAAIFALVHDVVITLGAVTAATYVANTAFGQALLIGDFKINLAIIAAFLTLIGYSLNDTIVVFDRIRENRKKAQLTAKTVNDSINQTVSRTIITSLTTFIVVLIMYIFGGETLRGFTFAIGFGIIIGTYSSIAIAAPTLLFGMKALLRSRS